MFPMAPAQSFVRIVLKELCVCLMLTAVASLRPSVCWVPCRVPGAGCRVLL